MQKPIKLVKILLVQDGLVDHTVAFDMPKC